MITQFIIIKKSGLINSNIEIHLNKKYVLKTGTTLISMPCSSIYHSFFEKEVTKRNAIKYDLTKIDSVKIKGITKNEIELNFYIKDTIILESYEFKK